MHCFVCGTRFVRAAFQCGTCQAPLPRESRLARYEAEELRAHGPRAPAVPPAAARSALAATTGPARLRDSGSRPR